MTIRQFWCAVLLCTAASLTQAQLAIAQSSNTSTDAQPDETRLIAMQIVALSMSEESMQKQFAPMLAQLEAAFKQDADISQLEVEYPGIISFMTTAIAIPIKKQILSESPDISRRMADIYVANISASHLQSLLEFYQSPTGQKVVEGMTMQIDFTNVFQEFITDPDNAEFTSENLGQSIEATVSKSILPTMSEEEISHLMAFSKTPAFAALTKANPLLIAEMAKWMNEPMPEAEAESEQLIVLAINEYIAASEEGREPVQPTLPKAKSKALY